MEGYSKFKGEMCSKDAWGKIGVPGDNHSRLLVGQGKNRIRELAKRNKSYLPKSGKCPYGPPLHGCKQRNK